MSAPLTPEELYVADVLFKARIYESNGQAYENLFVSVLEKRYSDFRPIKPHGSAGDRKNDGYSPAQGRYFQVYAPEDASARVMEAISKAKTDFAGLKSFWDPIAPIKEYRFVLNDKFHGPYPDIERTLAEIRAHHGLSVCECFLAKDLAAEFSHLNRREIMQVVGLLPDPSKLWNLDFSVLGQVLRHVMHNPLSLNAVAVLRVPDFNEKIRFNVSSIVGALFTKGSFQTGTVATFFEKNGSISKVAVRDKLADIYLHHKLRLKDFPIGASERGDAIFFAMLKDIVPSEEPAMQEAAIVLMAHFFESCDIYEDPTLVT